jgi:peptidoglycan/xylan/chitin deacetylase (PgdA/CDA1 family)
MLIKFIKIILTNPLKCISYIVIRFLKLNSTQKRLFYSKYLNKKFFFISFDCDTQEDINCLERLLQKLKDIKIKTILAIPAELIENNLDLIVRLKNQYSIEFLNHGYFIHTLFNKETRKYTSIFSYNQKNIEFIKKDIYLADQFFKDKLKIKIRGYRAPHFGEVNLIKKIQIFKYLRKLDYKFSSSSIYDMAYFFGAIFKFFGINEFSVTGIYKKEYRMLDSWSFLENINKVKLSNVYFDELRKLKNIFTSSKLNFINIYADPSHIIDSEEFFKIISSFSIYNIMSFEEIKI